MHTKTWNNTAFLEIPDSDDVDWPDLTSFLDALCDNAQTTNFQKSAIRIAVSSPITVVAATDHVVISNLTVPGAVAVNLPAGSNGQEFIVVDGKLDGATNNVTITPNGGDTIGGLANLVISTNGGGYKLKYSAVGTDWKVIESVSAAGLTRTSADQGAGRVQNKDFDDSSVEFVSAADVTKKLKFLLSSITAGNTRTVTVPDANLTMVGTATPQVITLKDFDGGTASNTNRLTLSKDTLANLSALTRKVGNLLFETTNNRPVYDNGSKLIPIGIAATLLTSSANYTALDADGYNVFNFFTGNSNRTFTLPTAANNTGRIFYVKKTDSGTGIVTITGTVDGVSNFILYNQYDFAEIVCDGTNYYLIGKNNDNTQALQDAAATRAGYKSYFHGTNYAGGNAPTVSGTNWTTLRAAFVPYQMQDGTWRLKFNITGTFSITTTNSNISVLSATSIAQDQAIITTQVTNSTGALINSYWPSSTTTPTFRFSTAVGDVRFSGDIELVSKPNWAY